MSIKETGVMNVIRPTDLNAECKMQLTDHQTIRIPAGRFTDNITVKYKEILKEDLGTYVIKRRFKSQYLLEGKEVYSLDMVPDSDSYTIVKVNGSMKKFTSHQAPTNMELVGSYIKVSANPGYYPVNIAKIKIPSRDLIGLFNITPENMVKDPYVNYSKQKKINLNNTLNIDENPSLYIPGQKDKYISGINISEASYGSNCTVETSDDVLYGVKVFSKGKAILGTHLPSKCTNISIGKSGNGKYVLSFNTPVVGPFERFNFYLYKKDLYNDGNSQFNTMYDHEILWTDGVDHLIRQGYSYIIEKRKNTRISIELDFNNLTNKSDGPFTRFSENQPFIILINPSLESTQFTYMDSKKYNIDFRITLNQAIEKFPIAIGKYGI